MQIFNLKATTNTPSMSESLYEDRHLWKKQRDHNKSFSKISISAWMTATLLNELLIRWHKVTQLQSERLVESMSRCMKAIIENQGYSTKYWFLNSFFVIWDLKTIHLFCYFLQINALNENIFYLWFGRNSVSGL